MNADDSPNAKALGAYYTDSQVAEFLVSWAVRNANDTVLDPSFGGGVFLRSACKRVSKLGGQPDLQVFGVELDEQVYKRISQALSDEFHVKSGNLVRSDFFDLAPERLRMVDVVVGNPPFIRYQRFTGDARARALRRAREHGLQLSELSSSWLPFLVHSIGLTRAGGRLAMVIPAEIGHASYAQPVLRHLVNSFAAVTFLTFRKKLFPELSEDTILLLCENRGAGPAKFFIRDVPNAGWLASIAPTPRLRGIRTLDTERISNGHQRLIESLLPRKARDLYRELRVRSDVVNLGSVADVGIGYVTGANDFFHLSPQMVSYWGIPSEFLRGAVRRGRSLAGLRYRSADWKRAIDSGEAGYLLHIKRGDNLPESVSNYLAYGRQQKVHEAFKCRTREPWFQVPHVYEPDAFLTYMSGSTPRLVSNEAGVVAPNSLHIVRTPSGISATTHGLPVLWQTSLARLSSEVEGHALGGGMLKLEPSEAEAVLLPWPADGHQSMRELAAELDAVSRLQGDDAATKRADREILRAGLRLSNAECALLLESAHILRDRRTARSQTS